MGGQESVESCERLGRRRRSEENSTYSQFAKDDYYLLTRNTIQLRLSKIAVHYVGFSQPLSSSPTESTPNIACRLAGGDLCPLHIVFPFLLISCDLQDQRLSHLLYSLTSIRFPPVPIAASPRWVVLAPCLTH